jgi:hypothetical protein
VSAVTYILFSQISPISSKFTQICSRFVLALTDSGLGQQAPKMNGGS